MRDDVSGFSWRFGLRHLFLWVLVVGLALGWWLDHLRSVEKIDLLNERIQYLSFTESLMESALTEGGFTITREVIERRGTRAIVFYFTTPDGKTYEAGCTVVSPGIDEMPEKLPVEGSVVIKIETSDPQ